MGFSCIRVYLFILYYALLSQNFEHLLLYNMHCNRYYNVSEHPHHIVPRKLDF